MLHHTHQSLLYIQELNSQFVSLFPFFDQIYNRSMAYFKYIYHCCINLVVFCCSILLFSDNVSMEFHGQEGPAFRGNKTGRLYLTTHRMIFNNKNLNDPMVSFSFPFCTISEVSYISSWKLMGKQQMLLNPKLRVIVFFFLVMHH